ncbi:hypothetical protein [Methylobrevis pamukkalensis]|uniref:hypothetical protein n=1 Tax=Methylobrevis pamukkalensis TaxID=1439726 RepID=UPI000845E90F|nr:hypothetical protein [Methylobrevis pamukkalensis]
MAITLADQRGEVAAHLVDGRHQHLAARIGAAAEHAALAVAPAHLPLGTVERGLLATDQLVETGIFARIARGGAAIEIAQRPFQLRAQAGCIRGGRNGGNGEGNENQGGKAADVVHAVFRRCVGPNPSRQGDEINRTRRPAFIFRQPW